MKHSIFWMCCVSLFCVMNLHSQTANTATIEAVAQAYGDQAQSVVTDYNRILGKNTITALHAVDSLSSKQAYSALALALPKVDESLKSSVVDALSKATSKDIMIIRSVSLELGNQNVIVIRSGGEDIAGQHVIKQKLVRILSRQTGIDASQVNVDNQQQVNNFLGVVDSQNN